MRMMINAISVAQYVKRIKREGNGMKTIIALALCSMFIGIGACRTSKPNKGDDFAFNGAPPPDASLDEFAEWREDTREARCAWWKKDRFGMFIHWGVYSVPAGTYNGKRIRGIGEWIMLRGRIPVAEYKAYARDFNPVNYDPEQWVRLAKEAGVKYIVITSKHHDGFALYDSKVTDWDIVDATPYGKDLLKPLAEACRRNGIKLGFYYSQAQDWCHPGGAARRGHWDDAQKGDMDEYIRNIAVPQVREVLSNYGGLGIFWWDTPVGMNPERARMLYPLLKLQPHVISNNRLGGGFDGDYGTPEQHIPGSKQAGNWETCMTMNGTWGYKSYDDNWKSTKTLVRNLVDIVSKGGNYLLNVGPKPDGTFPEASVVRLKEIGEWMDVYGDSIYACGASPLKKKPGWGRVTTKDGKLYVHVFDRPDSGRILLPRVRCRIEDAYLLCDPKQKISAGNSDNAISIELPGQLPNAIDSVIVVEYDEEFGLKAFVARENENGVVELTAGNAKLHGDKFLLESKGGAENIGYWTDLDDWAEWDFKVDKPGTFELAIEYAHPGAANSEYLIETKSGKLKGQIQASGSWGNFRKVKVGSVGIAKAGTHTLSFKATDKSVSPLINLRSIELIRK